MSARDTPAVRGPPSVNHSIPADLFGLIVRGHTNGGCDVPRIRTTCGTRVSALREALPVLRGLSVIGMPTA